MSRKLVLRFGSVPGTSEEATEYTDKLSLERLRAVAAGTDTALPRSQVMAILQATDFPNKHLIFEAVLQSENERAEIRYLAALYLGMIKSREAMEILIKNSHIRDERVLAGVMNALGRIGDKSALDAILTAKSYARGPAAMQAEFAATLIAHRLGLEESELPIPETRGHLERNLHFARPFRITRATDADADLCLRSLSGQQFGIEFSRQPMYQARCGRNSWMILLNREFGDKDSTGRLLDRKAFPCAVAIGSEQTRLYSTAYLLLTSPTKQKDAVNILVYHTTGKLSFTGTARLVGNYADFLILDLPQPGAFALKIEGTFEDGNLVIKNALSTTCVKVKKNKPIEGGTQFESNPNE